MHSRHFRRLLPKQEGMQETEQTTPKTHRTLPKIRSNIPIPNNQRIYEKSEPKFENLNEINSATKRRRSQLPKSPITNSSPTYVPLNKKPATEDNTPIQKTLNYSREDLATVHTLLNMSQTRKDGGVGEHKSTPDEKPTQMHKDIYKIYTEEWDRNTQDLYDEYDQGSTFCVHVESGELYEKKEHPQHIHPATLGKILSKNHGESD